jgi:lambda family phage portal protein
MRGGVSPFMMNWRPILRDAQEDVQRSWTDAAARVIDAMHNSGLLSGAVDQAVANVVGTGLRLNATPDFDWARRTERRFNDWANHPWSCDLGGRYTLHQLCQHGMRSHFATGEQVGTIPFIERPGSSHGTKINLLPSARLTQGGATGDVVQGVRLDANGAPTGYIFLNRDPLLGGLVEREVAARDSAGRPQVFHIFDGAPTATRGITPLAPVLQVIRQIDQLQNATLTASLIQAIFAASIESSAPTEDVMDALRSAEEQAIADGNLPPGGAGVASSGGWDAFMGARFKWYGRSKIDLGQFGKVFHAFPGENLKFHTPQHPGQNYKELMRMLCREVARCLGVTYEQFNLDNEGATYNSLNNETADIFEITKQRRVGHATPFMHTAYTCWLEEDIENGGTPYPGGIEAFLAQKIQATRADWQGPPRAAADEKKTAEANEVKLRNRVITRGSWAADLGGDIKDNDDQEKQENDNREELGLPPVVPVTNTTPNAPNGGRPTGPGAADPGEDPPEPGADPKDE